MVASGIAICVGRFHQFLEKALLPSISTSIDQQVHIVAEITESGDPWIERSDVLACLSNVPRPLYVMWIEFKGERTRERLDVGVPWVLNALLKPVGLWLFGLKVTVQRLRNCDTSEHLDDYELPETATRWLDLVPNLRYLGLSGCRLLAPEKLPQGNVLGSSSRVALAGKRGWMGHLHACLHACTSGWACTESPVFSDNLEAGGLAPVRCWSVSEPAPGCRGSIDAWPADAVCLTLRASTTHLQG